MNPARSLLGLALALAGPAALYAQPARETGDEVPNAHLDLPPNEIPTHLVKILRTTNKAQTNRYVPRVYDFVNVNPYQVIRFVRRVVEIEESAWFSFANPDMKSGKILVAVPDYQVPYFDTLMPQLDRPDLTSSGGARREYYRMRHRDASDLGVFEGTSAYGTPTNLLIVDPAMNALFLEDAPSGTEEMLRELSTWIDTPKEQLEALVRVYEVDVTEGERLGLDYISWKNGPGRNLFAIGAYAQSERIKSFDGTSSLLYNSGKGTFGLPGRKFTSDGYDGAFLFDLPSAFFDFLVAKGKARIMTQSKLTALQLTKSVLEIGEEVLFYGVQVENDRRGGARLQPLDPFGDLEPGNSSDGALVTDFPDNRTVVPKLLSINTGFLLEITPTIHVEDSELQIFMSLVNVTGYAADGTPVLSSRTLETVVNVPRDGREITLGGLVQQHHVDGADKMPFLGDIPILGYLFGGESGSDRKSMVVVTLSTRVLGAETTWTAEDAELEGKARGTLDFATPENDAGFLDD